MGGAAAGAAGSALDPTRPLGEILKRSGSSTKNLHLNIQFIALHDSTLNVLDFTYYKRRKTIK